MKSLWFLASTYVVYMQLILENCLAVMSGLRQETCSFSATFSNYILSMGHPSLKNFPKISYKLGCVMSSLMMKSPSSRRQSFHRCWIVYGMTVQLIKLCSSAMGHTGVHLWWISWTSGIWPVTWKACCNISNEMLAPSHFWSAGISLHRWSWRDFRHTKWNEKAAEQSKKLNHDCNMTAGLEPSFLWLLHESCCVATLTQTQAQMSEFVTELCHHRHLWSSFQLPEWPISTIQGSKSSMVSVVCLKEVNWLRDTYRKDLPLYVVLPLEPKRATKRKLAGTTHPDQSKAKKGISNSKTEKAPSPVRRHPLGNFKASSA